MKILMLGSARRSPRHPPGSDSRHLAEERWMLRSDQRRHSAIAVSQDGCSWMLLGAPLDLQQRLRHHAQFDRARGTGRNPVRAVLLADSSLCHSAGLLGFRDASPLDLYCTPAIVEELRALMTMVNRSARICWRSLPIWPGSPVASFRLEFAPALRLRAFMVSDAAPGEGGPLPGKERTPGTSIALIIDDLATGGRLFYAPRLQRIGEPEHQAMRQADCVIVNDGVWKKRPGDAVILSPSPRRATAGSGVPDVRDLLARISAGKPPPFWPSGADAQAQSCGEADYPGVTFDV